MTAHGLVFHIHNKIHFRRQLVSKTLKTVFLHGQGTGKQLFTGIFESRIPAVFQIKGEAGKIQVFPVLPFIAFLIDIQIVAVYQTVKKPDVEKPALICLLHDFLAF